MCGKGKVRQIIVQFAKGIFYKQWLLLKKSRTLCAAQSFEILSEVNECFVEFSKKVLMDFGS